MIFLTSLMRVLSENGVLMRSMRQGSASSPVYRLTSKLRKGLQGFKRWRSKVVSKVFDLPFISSTSSELCFEKPCCALSLRYSMKAFLVAFCWVLLPICTTESYISLEESAFFADFSES